VRPAFWHLYFSNGLSGPFLTDPAKRVRDCDKLSRNCSDDNLVWFSGGAKAVSDDLQDRLVVAGAEGGLVQDVAQSSSATANGARAAHLVRDALNFCSWKDRKAVAAKLRDVSSAEAAWQALEAFDAEWGRRYPSIAQAWRRPWQEVIGFFAFSPEIRRVICTTNAVESLNRVIRKAIRTRGSFPSEAAAGKLICLAIRRHEKTSRTVRGSLTAVDQFAMMFEGRLSPMRG